MNRYETFGRLILSGVTDHPGEWRRPYDVGTRAGCCDGICIRGGRVMETGPAWQDRHGPHGSAETDVTDTCLSAAYAGIRRDRLQRCVLLGAAVIIGRYGLGYRPTQVVSRGGIARTISGDVPADAHVCEDHSGFAVRVLHTVPGVRYVRLRNGELVRADYLRDKRVDASLVFA